MSNRRLKAFNENAEAYDRYRPLCPPELVKDLILLTALQGSHATLEIGCGTGQLTLDLAQRGHPVTALEIGPDLAAIARRKLATFPETIVETTDFTSWQSSSRFHLACSVQAFHWIDIHAGIAKVHEHLTEDGWLGLVWHVDESRNTDFWRRTSPVYEAFLPTPKERASSPRHTWILHEEYLASHPGFYPVSRRFYPWERTYTKEGYLGLLSTFSDQMLIEGPDRRKQFFAAIGEIIDEFGGEVTRFYKSVLLLAQKRS